MSFSKSESSTYDEVNAWTCSFCDLEFYSKQQFTSHLISNEHKENEQNLEMNESDKAPSYCFHQNYLESESCEKCNPYLLINEKNYQDFISNKCSEFHYEIESIFHCPVCSPTLPYCPICMEYYPFNKTEGVMHEMTKSATK